MLIIDVAGAFTPLTIASNSQSSVLLEHPVDAQRSIDHPRDKDPKHKKIQQFLVGTATLSICLPRIPN